MKIKKGMRVFAYQGDSERTDIATVLEVNEGYYVVEADIGDCYPTSNVVPIEGITRMCKYDAIDDFVKEMRKYWGGLKAMDGIERVAEQLRERIRNER